MGASIAMAVLALPLCAQQKTGAGLCDDIPHADHPKVTLHNGGMEAVVFLPDKESGYYRATRFDWSGLVPCVAVHGQRFFGEWSSSYDPMKNDAVVGPAEEFRTDTGVMGHYPATSPLTTMQTLAIGYDDAKVGEPFLKVGVGVLEKISDKPYSFGTAYPIVNGGVWTSEVNKAQTAVTFRQVLNGPNGWSYVYEKTLSLDKDGTGMTLEHSLQNTGTKPLDNKVYDHDFFIFDGEPAGPGMVVRFKFPPKPVDPMIDLVKVVGDEIQFQRMAQPKDSINAYITGYSQRVSDYDITVEDVTRGIGVEQTSDTPISRVLFWTNGLAVCPEVYVHVPVEPGKTVRWKLHYRFFTEPASR